VSHVHPGSSCSQYCAQVYAIAGAIWEPTAQQIIRPWLKNREVCRLRLAGWVAEAAAQVRPCDDISPW
jgi:hypothetical protein